MFLPEGANCHDLSHMHVSIEPSVYIRFLYKPINVINRPGSIAWESVLCRGTVSILNDREGGREERHRDEGRESGRSALFSPAVLFFSSSAYFVLCSAECVEKGWCFTISTNQMP